MLSGMYSLPILPEPSRMNMTFGGMFAVDALASGAFAMSVSAPIA